MDKDKLIETILETAHNGVDIEAIRPLLEQLYDLGWEKGYDEGEADHG